MLTDFKAKKEKQGIKGKLDKELKAILKNKNIWWKIKGH